MWQPPVLKIFCLFYGHLQCFYANDNLLDLLYDNLLFFLVFSKTAPLLNSNLGIKNVYHKSL